MIVWNEFCICDNLNVVLVIIIFFIIVNGLIEIVVMLIMEMLENLGVICKIKVGIVMVWEILVIVFRVFLILVIVENKGVKELKLIIVVLFEVWICKELLGCFGKKSWMGNFMFFELEIVWFSVVINFLVCILNVWCVNLSCIMSFGWIILNWNLLKVFYLGIWKIIWIDDMFFLLNDIRKVLMEKLKFLILIKWKGGRELLMFIWWVRFLVKLLILGIGKFLLVGICIVLFVFRGYGNWIGMFRCLIVVLVCCIFKLLF